jgi:hypothetical protein
MPKVIDRAPRLACHMRCAQHRARAVREQHAQIAIAAFRDAPEMARGSRGVFLRRQSEPRGEMARVTKVRDAAAGRRDHRRGGEEAHTPN